jgi:hypothetical protein
MTPIHRLVMRMLVNLTPAVSLRVFECAVSDSSERPGKNMRRQRGKWISSPFVYPHPLTAIVMYRTTNQPDLERGPDCESWDILFCWFVYSASNSCWLAIG